MWTAHKLLGWEFGHSWTFHAISHEKAISLCSSLHFYQCNVSAWQAQNRQAFDYRFWKTKTHTVKLILFAYTQTDMSTFPLFRPTSTSSWLYYTVGIFNQLYLRLWYVMTVFNVTNFSLYIFSLSRPVVFICTFFFPPDSSSLTWMHHAWPHHNFALPALRSLHFLILPLNGCSDALRFMLLVLVTAWLYPHPLITCPPPSF